jgi:alpha-tubulin suppressor-like RCC1 family protein
VACGRRYAMLLDGHGHIWTIGECKKYEQLGRCPENNSGRSIELMDSGCGHVIVDGHIAL